MVMWAARTETVAPDVRQLKIEQAGRRLTFADLIRLWRQDADFQAFWSGTLADLPFAAYCWEMPPLTQACLHQPFECVFVDNPALAATRADPAPFAEHFRAEPAAKVISFDNLGGDARLIVPCPQVEDAVYSHLATFVREAPSTQLQALWSTVADAASRQINPEPLWLSTAGLGVYWLHIRLDSRPKYYRYRPYADNRA